LNAEVGVFEDQAIRGRNAEALSGKKEGIGRRLGVDVFLSANDGLESIEQMDSGERTNDGVAAAAGYYGEGDVALLGFNVLDDFRDGFQLGQEIEVEALLAIADLLDRHVEPMHFIQR
jgi:hypothetical protein